MAKIADVLATERNRQQPTEWNKIHIFQMGDFYRAYEWSAWLIVAITYSDKVRHQQQGDRKPLKVSKKTLASGGSDFCFVGFPIKSLEKFVPERTNFTSTEEKHIVVTIQLQQPTDGSEVTYERLHEAFQKWRDILCRHYGRYVDDSTQIDPDREWLLDQVPREREFLADELGMQLHMGKLHIREVHQGVEFLGAFLKPYRDYVSRRTLERMTVRIQSLDLHDEEKAQRTMDSYLGILSHTASRHIAIDLGLASKPLAA